MENGRGQVTEVPGAAELSDPSQSGESRAVLFVHAWDRAELVARFLERFASLRGADLVLVLGPRRDYERFRAAESPGISVLFQDHFRKTEAQMTALTRTSHQVIVLTDVDCAVSQEWLDRLLQPILEGSEEVVTGPSLPPPSSNPLVQYQLAHDLALLRRGSGYADGILGRNTALTRRALIASGSFNTEIASGDDFWLGASLLRAGFRIRFLNNPIITDYPTTPGAYLSQQARWLRNILLHGPRIKADRELRSARLTACLSLGFMTSLAAAAVWVPAAVPGLLMWAWGIWQREKRLFQAGRFWRAALLVPFLVVLDHLARVAGLTQYLVPAWQSKW